MAEFDNVINGTEIAKKIREEIAEDVAAMKAESGKVPGLAVILVGARPDSQSYVRMKKKACTEAGIESMGYDYPVTVTEEELISKVQEVCRSEQSSGDERNRVVEARSCDTSTARRFARSLTTRHSSTL